MNATPRIAIYAIVLTILNGGCQSRSAGKDLIEDFGDDGRFAICKVARDKVLRDNNNGDEVVYPLVAWRRDGRWLYAYGGKAKDKFVAIDIQSGSVDQYRDPLTAPEPHRKELLRLRDQHDRLAQPMRQQ